MKSSFGIMACMTLLVLSASSHGAENMPLTSVETKPQEYVMEDKQTQYLQSLRLETNDGNADAMLELAGELLYNPKIKQSDLPAIKQLIDAAEAKLGADKVDFTRGVFDGYVRKFNGTGTMTTYVPDMGLAANQAAESSQPKAYNTFLESLEKSETWYALGAVREGGALDSFKGFKSTSAVYLPLVKENGVAELPGYDHDSLGLVNISGFRGYAEKAKSNPQFVATSETCGAALTYGYSSWMTNLLINRRPVYVFRRTVMQSELGPLDAKIKAELQADYQSVKLMCNNQKDQGLITGLEAVYNNLVRDIEPILPVVDKEYDVSFYPYVATVSCGMGDGNINVRACFKSTDLKVTSAEGVQLYKIYNMDQAGTIDAQGLHIKLPEHFSLVGQNDHNLLILSLVVKDRAGKVVYADKQGQYGVISVSH